MAALKHPGLLSVVGVVTNSRPFLLVTPLLHNGDLRTYLRGIRTSARHPARGFVSQHTLVTICCDLASALVYLTQRKILHRDLAARNVLVDREDGGRLPVVLGDFGMARELDAESEYYKKSDQAIPVRACR